MYCKPTSAESPLYMYSTGLAARSSTQPVPVVVNTAISSLRHERRRPDPPAAEDLHDADPVDALVVADALADLPERLRIPV